VWVDAMGIDLQLLVGGEVTTSAALLALLGELAIASGFNWVELDTADDIGVHIGVAALPDNCATKVDLVLLLDASASIGTHGYAAEKAFVSELVDFFDIGRDATQMAMLSYSQNVRTNFEFNTWPSATLMKAAISSAVYDAGISTATYKGIDAALAMFQSTTSGVRPETDGIVKVCVVLTDGASDDGARTVAAADKLRAQNVNVFSMGLGTQLDLAELRGIASYPVDEHVFQLDLVSDIETFASTIASSTCNEPATVNLCERVTTVIKAGAMRYFKPAYKMVTDNLIVEVLDLSGTSTRVFVSTASKNPSPFDYEYEASGSGTKRILVSSASGGDLYIGVWATGCEAGESADASDAVDNVAEVQFEIYNDIFAGVSEALSMITDVHEQKEAGLIILTPPAPKFTLPTYNPTVQYSLDRTTGDGANIDGNFPFAVDAQNGTITTTEPLLFDSRQRWSFRINANVVGDGDNSICVRGSLEIVVNVIPISTSATTTGTTTPTTTVTSTSTGTTATTTTTTFAASASQTSSACPAVAGTFIPLLWLAFLALGFIQWKRHRAKWPTETEIKALSEEEGIALLLEKGIDPAVYSWSDTLHMSIMLCDFAGYRNSGSLANSVGITNGVTQMSNGKFALSSLQVANRASGYCDVESSGRNGMIDSTAYLDSQADYNDETALFDEPAERANVVANTTYISAEVETGAKASGYCDIESDGRGGVVANTTYLDAEAEHNDESTGRVGVVANTTHIPTEVDQGDAFATTCTESEAVVHDETIC
jgi:collagen type VI alpha